MLPQWPAWNSANIFPSKRRITLKLDGDMRATLSFRTAKVPVHRFSTMQRSVTLFLGHCDLDLWPQFQTKSCPAHFLWGICNIAVLGASKTLNFLKINLLLGTKETE